MGPILKAMAATLDNRLATASLSMPERQTIERFVDAMRRVLGENLRGLWLYGSRARGNPSNPDSDVDLMVIVEGGRARFGRAAMDLSEEAAIVEGESPFRYSVHVHDPQWLERRREIESFFIQEVDRDKIVLAGSALD